jgi:hypothetical protein
MIPILITVYLFCGVVFMTLLEDSQPEIIKNHKPLQIIVEIVSMILWLPWFLINMCFVKRDIWFRLKTDDRFRIY